MGTRSRVSGELAGSSESRRPSPQVGRAGPKLPTIGSSTELGRRGGPGGQRYNKSLRSLLYATTLRAPSPLLLCLQPATLPLGTSLYTASSPGRSPSYTRAVAPGSVSVEVTYMQPASGLFHVPHIHQHPGATNIKATPPIPVEAVAQNQYHCPGSSCWDVSGGPAGGRLPALGEAGWRGRRLKSVRVVHWCAVR